MKFLSLFDEKSKEKEEVLYDNTGKLHDHKLYDKRKQSKRNERKRSDKKRKRKKRKELKEAIK